MSDPWGQQRLTGQKKHKLASHLPNSSLPSRFWGPPRAWNYLSTRKGGGGSSSRHVVWKRFRKNWVVSLGLNLFSMCQRQQWTHCLGAKLTSEESFKEEWCRPPIRSRPEASWLKNWPPETYCSYSNEYHHLRWTDFAFLMISIAVKGCKDCCCRGIHLGSVRQNFFRDSES